MAGLDDILFGARLWVTIIFGSLNVVFLIALLIAMRRAKSSLFRNRYYDRLTFLLSLDPFMTVCYVAMALLNFFDTIVWPEHWFFTSNMSPITKYPYMVIHDIASGFTYAQYLYLFFIALSLVQTVTRSPEDVTPPPLKLAYPWWQHLIVILATPVVILTKFVDHTQVEVGDVTLFHHWFGPGLLVRTLYALAIIAAITICYFYSLVKMLKNRGNGGSDDYVKHIRRTFSLFTILFAVEIIIMLSSLAVLTPMLIVGHAVVHSHLWNTGFALVDIGYTFLVCWRGVFVALLHIARTAPIKRWIRDKLHKSDEDYAYF
ncbi:hypothetical protein J8273_7839 [Carpediemonas membranifera]|uniref:Uncharacterized protein n=1 Tax=Carpediemonas membranifera TaxID=201153 RepID=A0A8J6DZB5_9EUKA|nr:hypothetical protein J8273_7839 [Carpediemonas membranifera]|eukprot:KAG9390488.1 hypothetical protein J8273_7839 [Carpediemonas membranifera]